MAEEVKGSQSNLTSINIQLVQLISDREALWEKTSIPDDPDYPVVQTKEALLERIQALEALETKFKESFERRRPDEHVCLKECRTALKSLGGLETKIALFEKQIAEEHATGSKPKSATPVSFAIHEHIEASGAMVHGQVGSNFTDCTFNVLDGVPEEEAPVSAVPVLERLRKSLREMYKSYTSLERLFAEGATPIVKSFVNLALIKEAEQKTKEKGLGRTPGEEKDDGGGEGDGSEQEKFPAHVVDECLASHEQLYAVKEPLALTELFESTDDTLQPNKVLVLGRAGTGKSILCQYLATQWASEAKEEMPVADYLQKKFEAVFWIRLREIAASARAQDTLVDVLNRFCLTGSKANRPTKQELTRYLDTESDKVLFILDGYDEVADARHLDHILEELSNHTHLLLTARPIVIEKLGNKRLIFDRRLENMGFLNENIEAYIHQFMLSANQPEQAALMMNFLKSHAGVWGIAHIPINLELLSWLWSKGELTLGQGQVITLSKLYQIIVARVQEISAQKASHPANALAPNDVVESKAEEGVASRINVNIFLEYLAFHARRSEIIPAERVNAALEAILPVQSYNKAQRIQLLKSATDKLGFLRSTGQGGRSPLDQTYYFVSFQEFYAAKYIARILSEQPESQQAQQVLECIRVEKYTRRYQLMLWMSAGLLYQHGKPTCTFSALTSFEKALLSPPRALIGFHHRDLVMHCVDECEADPEAPLYTVFMEQHRVWLQPSRCNAYIDQLVRCPVLLASQPIVQGFLENLENKEKYGWGVRSAAVRALGKLNSPDQTVLDALLAVMKDETENVHVREAAVNVLGYLKDSNNAVTAVLVAVKKKNEYEHVGIAAIACVVAYLANPKEASLIPTLEAMSINMRLTAIEALGNLSNPNEQVIIALQWVLEDEGQDEQIKRAAIEALGKRRNPNEHVIRLLQWVLQNKGQDPKIRKDAIEALGNLDNPSEAIITALLGVVQDNEDNQWVRQAAVSALGHPKDRIAVITGLLGVMKDREWCVRSVAVNALGHLQDPSTDVITALMGALEDEESGIKRAAASALVKLRGEQSLKVVFEGLTAEVDPKDLTQYIAYFRNLFERNCLLCVDHLKGEVIFSSGHETYHIPMSKEKLHSLERQIAVYVDTIARAIELPVEALGFTPPAPSPLAPTPSQANNPARLMSQSGRSDAAQPPAKKGTCLVM